VTDSETLQRYINDFRRHFARYLKPGVGITSKVYPAETGGAILVFTIGPGVKNEDEFAPATQSVNQALQNIPQSAFGGNLQGFIFRGTNLIAEGNRFIIIKGEDSPSDWTDSDAAAIVSQIVGSVGRSAQ